MATFMLHRCVIISRGNKNVQMEKTVSMLIPLSRNTIAIRNTKNISVFTIPTLSMSVPMEIFVPMHTPKRKFCPPSSIIMLKTKIFTCFIIKLNSVLSISQNMTLQSVSMLITGKTTEDSPITSITKQL